MKHPLTLFLLFIFPFSIFSQKTDTSRAAQFREIGNVYFNSKLYQKAIEKYTKAIEVNSLDKGSYYLRGKCYASTDKTEEGLKDLNKAIAIDKNFSEAYFSRAILKSEYMKDFDGALADYGQCIRLAPASANVYIMRGRLEFFMKQYEAAIADFTKSISIDPAFPTPSADAYNGRAYCYYYLGNYVKALADFNKVSESPLKYNILYNRCLSKRKTGDMKGALSDINELIQYDPSIDSAYIEQGYLRFKSGDTLGAYQSYSKCLQLNPNRISCYYNRALVLMAMKQYKKAIEDLYVVLTYNPRDALALGNRGIARRESGDLAGACKDMQEAYSITPDMEMEDWLKKYCR
ncbi:MAG: tetratricopeptide repeat protein [Bacteroidia bacterium]